MACGGTADVVLHLCLKKMPSKTTSQGFCFTFPFSLNWQGTLNLSPLLSHSPVLKGIGPTPYLIISFKISFVIAYPQFPFSLILKALRGDFSEVFGPVFFNRDPEQGEKGRTWALGFNERLHGVERMLESKRRRVRECICDG